jgi:hypothetical protein
MHTVYRNRTLSRLFIRNAYCAQKQNTFQTMHQKCAMCTETEHIPDDISYMCTVHRTRTLSKTAKLKCVLYQETEHFPEGKTEMYTMHTKRTHSRRYIRNVYCAHGQNTLQTVIRNMYCAQKQSTFHMIHQK